MDTKIIKIDEADYDKSLLRLAAEALAEGGTVAFPTETVYGIGANALDETAIKKIFKAKGRPSDNPLIVHVTSVEAVKTLVEEISPVAQKLMDAFWPGPLTIIFRKSVVVPESVTAGLDTVAIRMPSHPIARDLIDQSGVPVAAPSANLSGKPSPTSGEHVIEDLNGRVDYIVVGDQTEVGLESTVVDATGDTVMILRPGGVTREALEKVVPVVCVDPAIEGHQEEKLVPRSPGMKYTHYAPEAEVLLIQGQEVPMVEMIQNMCVRLGNSGKRVGIMTCDEHLEDYNCGVVISLGSRQNLEEVAQNLFKTLRDFDAHGVDIILAEVFDEHGMGSAVMNRLRKAAGNQVIEV
ncbi:MAG: threonylcarbamoyl-AMP synthase [Clostridia bacterium]|nr:threonylcarbamoyl-AMP synthase [Clostridia bacterium]